VPVLSSAALGVLVCANALLLTTWLWLHRVAALWALAFFLYGLGYLAERRFTAACWEAFLCAAAVRAWWAWGGAWEAERLLRRLRRALQPPWRP
jgi:hypothetical protein